MEGIGVPELLIALVIVIILFGPSRLAGAGKALGDTIRSFRHALRDDDSTSPTGDERRS